MPDSNSISFLTAYDSQAQIRNEISAVAINWYINRCPIVTRVARKPVGSIDYSIVNTRYRPRAFTLGANVLAGDTVVTLNDSSPLMVGDVLELPGGDRVEVVSDPNIVANTVVVRRAAEGTTAGTATSGQAVTLIGNSRTGAEVNQSGTNFLPIPFTQHNQTYQHPVQVGGSLQSSTAFVPAAGANTPFDQAKMNALQNMMDDMEVSSYYGRGEAASSGVGRPKQIGMKYQIRTNNTATPTNAGAYKPTDLIRDTIQKCRQGGGDPDVLVVSPEFNVGFAIWQQPIIRMMVGDTIFGNKIDAFQAPLAGGLTIVYAPLMKPYSAFCLSSRELFWRNKRSEFWNPRGVRGDAMEGDWMAEGSIEVDNEQHHAYVEGISAFSAT